MSDYSNDKKGNIAEFEIASRLTRFPEIEQAHIIPEQYDTNHWDIDVTLRKGSLKFKVQAKWFSAANCRINIKHIKDWLNSQTFTVPMWWRDENQQAYWGDPLRALIRQGGIKEHQTMRFDIDKDLHLFDPTNSNTRKEFVSWITAFCQIWPAMQSVLLNFPLSDLEFPIGLVHVVQDPDILSFLPVNANLLTALRPYQIRSEIDQTEFVRHTFAAGSVAMRSPPRAAKKLSLRYGISDPDVVRYLEHQLSLWAERIGVDRALQVASTLGAFDRLIAMLTYEKPGDVIVPDFVSQNTYPLGRLVNLLPLEIVHASLERILTRDNDPTVLQYGAYLLGILNYPPDAKEWVTAHEMRRWVRQQADKIGPAWPIVDRQMLYTEVQLGGEAAKEDYFRRLTKQGGVAFDAPLDYFYYGRNAAIIQNRFERRLEEDLRTDRLVRNLLEITYSSLRDMIKEDSPLLHGPNPKRWPIDTMKR